MAYTAQKVATMISIDEIAERLTPIFDESGVTRAVIFGSYAKGTSTDTSDVDIVIETEPHVRGLMFYGILGRVVDVLGVKVDMIPKRSIKPNSPIEKEISETGRVIYERR